LIRVQDLGSLPRRRAARAATMAVARDSLSHVGPAGIFNLKSRRNQYRFPGIFNLKSRRNQYRFPVILNLKSRRNQYRFPVISHLY
jgi:hypothetical protein